MSEGRGELKSSRSHSKSVLEACPHCGQDLSPWQQVLLTVDRALVCRKCWYRIILEPQEEPKLEDKPRSRHGE